MRVARLLKAAAFAGGAAIGAYVGTRLAFSMICLVAGHNFTEEIYATASIALLTVAWASIGAFASVLEA